MSLNGDLEHFPLVDVIQLLHMTGKTGILSLKSSKGESQLVFNEGFFVSANHLNNSVRIGKILIDMDAITPAMLNQALAEQKEAGKDRKPLIATLIEQGMIDKETAFKGLETLIEMTIVEVFTWKVGTFSFDVSDAYVSDEYRYFPEKLHMKILLNTQGVLMESLRIYDEMMRDGTINKMFFSQDNCDETDAPSFDTDTKAETVLCLDALDTISKKVQDLFTGLKECVPTDGSAPEVGVSHQEELVMYLNQISAQPEEDQQDYTLLPDHCEPEQDYSLLPCDVSREKSS
jgi:hypothetical protein